MDIKSLITIEELPTVGSTNPEQEYLLLQTPEKTGKMPLSNLPSKASKIGFDNKGTNLSSNTVQAAITELDSSLKGFEPIVDDTGKITGYKTAQGGADTVFPFSSKPESVTFTGGGGGRGVNPNGSCSSNNFSNFSIPTMGYSKADFTLNYSGSSQYGKPSSTISPGTNIDITNMNKINISWNVSDAGRNDGNSYSCTLTLHD